MRCNLRCLLFLPAILLAMPSSATASTLTVTNANDKGPGSLRCTVNNAKDSDIIVFASSLTGKTITLTSDQITLKTSIDIEGPGAGLLSVSGNDVNRVFNIPEGLTVTMNGLTITHGRGTGGAGILNSGSALTMTNDVLSYNTSPRANIQDPNGGAIRNELGANLVVSNSSFLKNLVFCGNNQGDAGGGGIFNNNKTSAMVVGCTFSGNQSFGGSGGVLHNNGSFMGHSEGGAIHNDGSLTVTGCTFADNQVTGGSGATVIGSNVSYVAFGSGGAIHNDGIAIVTDSTFSGNQAIGGSNGSGGGAPQSEFASGYGGAITNTSSATVAGCTFDDNQARGGCGNSGAGTLFTGVGAGGAIDNFYSGATLTISSCTFINNLAIGGAANKNATFTGTGVGGGITNQEGATALVTGSTFLGNQATGGVGANGATGGEALGGGLSNFLSATLTVHNCTVTANQASGGAAGTGGAIGSGIGGGFYLTADGTVCFDLLTSANTAGNTASTAFMNIFGDFTICP